MNVVLFTSYALVLELVNPLETLMNLFKCFQSFHSFLNYLQSICI